MAELAENGKRRILGVARVGIEPDGKAGEIAFIVADPWQGYGLGTKMVDYAIEIAKDMNIQTLYTIMLPDNFRAVNLMKKMGFTITYPQDGTVKGTLSLNEEEQAQPTELGTVVEPRIETQTTRTEQEQEKEAQAT